MNIVQVKSPLYSKLINVHLLISLCYKQFTFKPNSDNLQMSAYYNIKIHQQKILAYASLLLLLMIKS